MCNNQPEPLAPHASEQPCKQGSTGSVVVHPLDNLNGRPSPATSSRCLSHQPTHPGMSSHSNKTNDLMMNRHHHYHGTTSHGIHHLQTSTPRLLKHYHSVKAACPPCSPSNRPAHTPPPPPSTSHPVTLCCPLALLWPSTRDRQLTRTARHTTSYKGQQLLLSNGCLFFRKPDMGRGAQDACKTHMQHAHAAAVMCMHIE